MAYPLRRTDEDVLIAEGAAVVGDVTLGKGVSVWYNAAIRGDQGAIVIGENTNVQDCAVIHERATIGRNCTIGHGAVVHGCTVGDNVLIGMGAIIVTGARIGRNCIIGAGALVTGKMDVPAKVVRPLTEAELRLIHDSMEEYMEMARCYRLGGQEA